MSFFVSGMFVGTCDGVVMWGAVKQKAKENLDNELSCVQGCVGENNLAGLSAK